MPPVHLDSRVKQLTDAGVRGAFQTEVFVIVPLPCWGGGLPHFVRNASALPSGCDIRWAQVEGWQLDLGRRVWRRKQDSRRGGQAAGFPAGPPLPPEGGAWPLPPSGAVWSAGHAIPAMQAPGLPSLSCCRCPSLALGPCPCREDTAMR